MRYNYADTKRGEVRTMCVFFDFKDARGLGSRGVVTAYTRTHTLRALNEAERVEGND